MELDVHLTREGGEPWGFEFISCANYEIPLTIDKVFPSTPAHTAGLQVGDVVARLGDKLTTELSLEAALDVVAEAVCSLSFGIYRGLYDPVLDDYEPVYEPIERADSDPRSEPTEVPFPIQKFDPNELSLDDPNILDLRVTDPSLYDSGYHNQSIAETRSLTASPFVPNTKPYRSFSTEPLEVPLLEDPLILNRNFIDTNCFKDQFVNVKLLDPEEEKLLHLLPLDKNVEAKFKLPISEKYDPNWENKAKEMLTICPERGRSETEHVEHELVYAGKATDSASINVLGQVKKKDVKFCNEVKIQDVKKRVQLANEEGTYENKLKEEINMETIEQTALKVVEESIKHAVFVAEEVQREIREELTAPVSRELQINNASSETKAHIEKTDCRVERKESDSKSEVTESVAFDKERNVLPAKKKVTKKVRHAEEYKAEHVGEFKSSESFNTETKQSEGNQKAYMIGLQTIPHMKGYIQSSYHFDLLLRTFFVHLTDIMVALSRFILTQPTAELEGKAEKVIKDKLIKEFASQDSEKCERRETERRHEEFSANIQQQSKRYKNEIQETQQVRHNIRKLEENKVKKEIFVKDQTPKEQETLEMSLEEVEKRKKSGAEMAQMTQRKSKDFTNKMDAVITEFETKTGVEDRLEVTEKSKRRSRNCSKIEEEVMRESDPLEGLDKVGNKKASQGKTDVTTIKKGFSAFSESKVSRKSEIKLESRTTKVKPGEQMYIAIVESHTYPNKTSIVEDQVTEMSETASVQSSEDINAALESLETMSMESVAISEMQIAEKQHAAEIISNAIQEVVQEKQEVLETVTDFETHITEQQAVAKVEYLAIAVAESTDAVVDDSKLETFESKQLISQKAEVATEETFKSVAVECTEIAFEEVQEQHSELAKTGQVTVTQERTLPVAGIIETKSELCKEPKKAAEDEYVSLKIVREVFVDVGEPEEILSESELSVNKSLEVEMSASEHIQSSISQSQKNYQSINQEISSSVQESSQSSARSSKLHIRTDLVEQKVLEPQLSGQSDENINTPTPSTVPPTPLTDEYIFKLEIPLPKNEGPLIVQEESPDREDPHIVKKGLVPHIETVIEDQIIYDPPLPTPPVDGVRSPVYTKPGLRGGAEPLFRKAYIREIERKSSLLASAIDQTIKSIEEYKEDVGIETKQGVIIQKSLKSAMKTKKHEEAIVTNGFNYTNGLTNGHGEIDKEIESKIKEKWEKVTKINEDLKGLSYGKEQSKTKAGGTENDVIENENEGKGEENDAVPGFKPVVFNPEAFQARLYEEVTRGTCEMDPKETKIYMNECGEPLGGSQGIIDGLEEATVDERLAKELGKPGMTDDKIAELISGESEMLREAHVMGLARVLASHMNRDDCSVDFQLIKPLVDSLKDSEVVKLLNEELIIEKKEEKNKKEKKDEQKWTTFMQKPKRSVPKAKSGGFGEPEDEIGEQYKVKIVKQPKPKVAPDYKPEDFETGPLPWEQRALTEPVPSPVPPEEPILVPEETPEFLEAVDTLPESEVPDLEDSGIPLPSPPPSPPILSPEPALPELPPELPEELPPEDLPPPEPEVEQRMHGNQMAEQLMNTVRSMVDPNASLEQQLGQMRAQLATLAQLPCVIQQSLEMLTRQLSTMSHQEAHQKNYETEMIMDKHQEVQAQNNMGAMQECPVQEAVQNYEASSQDDTEEQNTITIEEVETEQEKPKTTAQEYAQLKREEEAMVEEQRRSEKEKKKQQEKLRLDQESRQIKQRAAPRVGKPKPVFGPPATEERPVVLPGGRRWRGPKDAFDEQMIAETLLAQAEMLQGKVLGYESDLLPYDNRINFMKYEKPPVNLDHLQNSATYKLVHNMEQKPLRRTELLTPVIAEADYREKCRSVTPMQTNGRN